MSPNGAGSARPEHDLRPIFDAIREAAKPGIWSRGIQLARRQTLRLRDAEPGELAAEVCPGGPLPPVTVYLQPDACEWECECDSLQDVCEHAAAAVIALRQAAEDDVALPRDTRTPAHVRYQFVPEGRSLTLERWVESADARVPLRGTVRAAAARRDDRTELIVRDADLRVESVLAGRLEGPPNTGLMQRLLRALRDSDTVYLRDRRIEVSADPLLPLAVVEDSGEGFVVCLRRDPSVREVFANRVALCGGVLRPVGEPHLHEREREALMAGRYFGPHEVELLVSEVLPDLARRIPVDVRTRRLPDSERVAPRSSVRVERRGDGLHVVPSIVYGDPPLARVEGGQLTRLGETIPVRDLRAEERLLEKLRSELDLDPQAPVVLEPEPAIAFRERLERFGGQIEGRAHEEFFRAPALEPQLDLGSGSIQLGFSTQRNGQRVQVDAKAALARWRLGSGLMALPGGGFAPLPADWLERFGPLVSDLLAARAADGSLPRCMLPDLARLCEQTGAPPPPEFGALRALLRDFAGLPEPELPSDLCAELRDYQRAGVRWLCFMGQAELGGLLADDMGLGKTLQTLCAVRGRSLVVCPTSVLVSWTEQIERFRPALRVCVYHGPRRSLDPDADVTLTSYALLRLDLAALERESWETVVLDEAQAIKNPDSQVAQAAYRLPARHRITLTGTPVENRLEELWSQMHFLNPGLLGSRQDFQERYALALESGEPGAAARLAERIRPFVLRRLKRDVARELPERTELVLHCELAEPERALYDAVLAATRGELLERLQSSGSVLEVLEALLRLRQACCHPGLVPGQSAASSSKIEVLLDSLGEAVSEGHKSLVFSQWTKLLDLVEPHLASAGLEFTRLDGSTRDRAAVVEAFQADDGPPVLLISLRAGGTGLNLTAADHVYLLDPWWNPAVEDQAADRAHRIGQERPVFIHRLVARDSVEERILSLQQRKRALAESALGGGAHAGAISREELLELLG